MVQFGFIFVKLSFPKDIANKIKWNLEKKMVRAKQSISSMTEMGEEKINK